MQGGAAAAGITRGPRRRARHPRGHGDVGQARARVVRQPRAERDRAPDRALGPARDQRATALPRQRRHRLPLARPGAGEHGGWIVAQGTPQEIMEVEESATGQFLAGTRLIEIPPKRRKPSGKITIEGARQNNLKKVNVDVPLGVFTCVTGVSGSGKSTLVNEILYRAVANKLHRAKLRPGQHRRVKGLDQVDKIVNIDQSPIGRTPRSNPATYTGVFDQIRDLFSRTQEARARGYKPGRFSFNVKGGRCEVCR